MTNPLYKQESENSPRLLLTKKEAAEALGVSTRVLEALEKRGDIKGLEIPPCFPKANPTARTRRGPQAMKRYALDDLQEYVARLQNEANSRTTDPKAQKASPDHPPLADT